MKSVNELNLYHDWEDSTDCKEVLQLYSTAERTNGNSDFVASLVCTAILTFGKYTHSKALNDCLGNSLLAKLTTAPTSKTVLK